VERQLVVPTRQHAVRGIAAVNHGAELGAGVNVDADRVLANPNLTIAQQIATSPSIWWLLL
jgi:hypothetical protein